MTLNLLSNAIKFTPQGGTITIKVGWTSAGGQYLSIRDTGPGIAEEEIPIVLSSFGRGSLAQKNAEEGSGLGLPIVKGLVELHGGEFRLKSKLREGTEVIVIFPPERVMDALPQLDPTAPPEETPEQRAQRRARRWSRTRSGVSATLRRRLAKPPRAGEICAAVSGRREGERRHERIGSDLALSRSWR